MAGTAGPRRHIAIAGDFHRTIGRLPARRRRAASGNASKNAQEREIFDLAHAPEWAHHFRQDVRPDVTAEAVMMKLSIMSVSAVVSAAMSAAIMSAALPTANASAQTA